MKRVAAMTDEERTELFQTTAIELGMQPVIVEKDFWVCFMLDHLFHESAYKDAWVFKGGTSLSKSYHLIKRFSEDIDLILDWTKILEEDDDPWKDRSHTQQDRFDKELNKRAAAFYADELVPALNTELTEKFGNRLWCGVDVQDEMVVDFYYPCIFNDDYIRPYVRLEIGPLAEWSPSHVTVITPFAAEQYPEIFEQPDTSVLTVDAERTFWEKITILHKTANLSEDKPLPARYARHMYDVFCMGHSEIKEKAFEQKDLLARDVLFKQKFYYSKSAHYESATLQNITLIPSGKVKHELENDYKLMRNMIYGEVPDFEELMAYLEELQEEIHNLAK